MKQLREKAEKALLFLSYMVAVTLVLFVALLVAAGINYVANALFN